MSKISVIVPVYNVEKYLRRCIDSIINQTFSDFDLILIDDGSPDNSPVICDEYAEKDNRIHVIHQNNGGLSAARNTGIDWSLNNSDSEWITFIDSDDWVHEEMLELLLDAALKHNVFVSICDYMEIYDEVIQKTEDKVNYIEYRPEDFFCKNVVVSTVACWKLYNKLCFNKIRYPLGKLHEDEFTTYKILFKLDKIVYIDKKMYFYYQNKQSITHSSFTLKRMDMFDAFEQQIEFFNKNKFYNAEKVRIHHYLCGIHSRIEELKKEKHKNWKLLRKLYERKFLYFIKYAKKLDPYNDIDQWVLTKVFPKLMYIYTHILSLKDKFKKL